jgi:hypothetical protein
MAEQTLAAPIENLDFDSLWAISDEAEFLETMTSRIDGLLVNYCNKVRTAIYASDMNQADYCRLLDISYSALSVTLSGNMRLNMPDLIELSSMLFPRQTLDKVLFGEQIQMPLLNIDRLLCSTISFLRAAETARVKTVAITLRTNVKAPPSTAQLLRQRLSDLQEDRSALYPFLPRFSHSKVPATTLIRLLREDTERVKVRTFMYAAIMNHTSLDYMSVPDYSNSSFYFTGADGYIASIPAHFTDPMRYLAPLTLEQKTEVLRFALQLLDKSPRHRIV